MIGNSLKVEYRQRSGQTPDQASPGTRSYESRQFACDTGLGHQVRPGQAG